MAKVVPVQAVIHELGGIAEVARGLGHKNHTTVQYWFNQGKLPKWRRAELQALAESRGIQVPRELRAA